MTNCIYCHIEVEKEDLCLHRHGAHKECCKKNDQEFLDYVIRQSRVGDQGRFNKEMLHVDFYQ